MRAQRAHQVAILNYRRDGSPHWVLLHVAPVFHAADGRVLHFLAVQVPIAAAVPRSAACRGPALFAACREEARLEEELPCATHAREVFVDIDKRGRPPRQKEEQHCEWIVFVLRRMGESCIIRSSGRAGLDRKHICDATWTRPFSLHVLGIGVCPGYHNRLFVPSSVPKGCCSEGELELPLSTMLDVNVAP
ncbi:hypothetical protein QYE76_043692 [Lolium multiflorum]|uniref:Uncharacterized protein n=1 Tax=Lolium multiflorum TaxID=4521 RepID=A0AAD8TJG7_LOLMU|nr:hypothetical protein QYE76_043692 [Lolium multiflorum]